jgi:hypothetical protein
MKFIVTRRHEDGRVILEKARDIRPDNETLVIELEALDWLDARAKVRDEYYDCGAEHRYGQGYILEVM